MKHETFDKRKRYLSTSNSHQLIFSIFKVVTFYSSYPAWMSIKYSITIDVNFLAFRDPCWLILGATKLVFC